MPYMIDRLVLFIAIVVVLATAGCGQQKTVAENTVFSTGKGDVQFRVETVAAGLEVPWARP